MSFSFDEYVDKIKHKNINGNSEMEYKRRFIPRLLYKYGSFNSSHIDENLSRLVDGEIWMPNVSTLNDPFEFEMYRDTLSKERKLEFRKDILGRFSILSLSSDIDSLLLWSMYSDAYSGYCLEFEVVRDELIFPVVYKEKQIDYTSEIEAMFKIKSTILTKNISELSNEELAIVSNLYRIPCTKRIEWKHENEYRILLRDIENYDENKWRIKKGFWYKYSEIGVRLKRIILGFNCDYINVGKIMNYINTLNDSMLMRELVERNFNCSVDYLIKEYNEMGCFIDIAKVIRKGQEFDLSIEDFKRDDGVKVKFC